MWLLRSALRNPISVIVLVIAVALCSILALLRMPIDIFPNLNLPVIYVAQPYGGMSPAQMEGYITYYYEYHFLYVNGIESVESKSIHYRYSDRVCLSERSSCRLHSCDEAPERFDVGRRERGQSEPW